MARLVRQILGLQRNVRNVHHRAAIADFSSELVVAWAHGGHPDHLASLSRAERHLPAQRSSCALEISEPCTEVLRAAAAVAGEIEPRLSWLPAEHPAEHVVRRSQASVQLELEQADPEPLVPLGVHLLQASTLPLPCPAFYRMTKNAKAHGLIESTAREVVVCTAFHCRHRGLRNLDQHDQGRFRCGLSNDVQGEPGIDIGRLQLEYHSVERIRLELGYAFLQR